MKPDIDCLRNLSLDQLRQLRVFIENLGYRKAAERASEEFNQPIHKAALQRFMLRAAPAEFLDEDLDSEEATRQILKFAADGQPEFTATTVHILEKLAFQLSLTCHLMDEDMNALAKVTTMLTRFRNASVRERMVVVQEGKLKLRQQQFEKDSNHDTDAYIADINQRISHAFGQHPLVTAIRKAEAAMHCEGVPPPPAPQCQIANAQSSMLNEPSPLSPAAIPPDEKMPKNKEAAPVPPKNKNSKNAPFASRNGPGVRSVPTEGEHYLAESLER